MAKKYSSHVDVWKSYIEYLFEKRTEDGADPRDILSRSLQALPQKF